MTRKDFELVASALRKAHEEAPDDAYPDHFEGIEAAAKSVARALRTTNPRFDRRRFLAACRPDTPSA